MGSKESIYKTACEEKEKEFSDYKEEMENFKKSTDQRINNLTENVDKTKEELKDVKESVNKLSQDVQMTNASVNKISQDVQMTNASVKQLVTASEQTNTCVNMLIREMKTTNEKNQCRPKTIEEWLGPLDIGILNLELTDYDLCFISKCINPRNILQVGLALKLRESEINTIKHDSKDNVKEQAYTVIKKWTNKQGKKGKLKTLLQSLFKVSKEHPDSINVNELYLGLKTIQENKFGFENDVFNYTSKYLEHDDFDNYFYD